MKELKEQAKKRNQFINSIDGLTYLECRAYEQGFMVGFHTLAPNDSNKINGIGQTNKKLPIYKAAWNYFKNQLENEWLNFKDIFD